MRRPLLQGAVLAAALLATGLPAQAADPLTVCLEENVPPLSQKRGREAAGFDVEVARRVAERLGRPFQVQWYETKADPDSYPDRQVNAMLSDGRCQLVGGYPFSALSLRKPASDRSRLPDFEGAKPEDRRRWVTIGTLAPSRPYRFAGFAVVLGPQAGGVEVQRLADLARLRLGVEEVTLADAILTNYGGGTLAERLTHVPAGDALFARLERGDYDAVLVDLHRFDAWKQRHPESPLRLSGYRHSIGFNLGFVALSTEAALLSAVNDAIAGLREGGTLPEIARAAGVTYHAPREPDIRPQVTSATLRGD